MHPQLQFCGTFFKLMGIDFFCKGIACNEQCKRPWMVVSTVTSHCITEPTIISNHGTKANSTQPSQLPSISASFFSWTVFLHLLLWQDSLPPFLLLSDKKSQDHVSNPNLWNLWGSLISYLDELNPLSHLETLLETTIFPLTIRYL